jgi:hypothetical protein
MTFGMHLVKEIINMYRKMIEGRFLVSMNLFPNEVKERGTKKNLSSRNGLF